MNISITELKQLLNKEANQPVAKTEYIPGTIAAKASELLDKSPGGVYCESLSTEIPHPFETGKNYFIKTVTHHYTGVLEAVYPGELVLSKAAWIADDGRFSQAVQIGEFDEVEPFGTDQLVIIGRGSIIDAVQIKSVPISQK